VTADAPLTEAEIAADQHNARVAAALGKTKEEIR
jgi:hypothetical protein